MSPSSQGPDPFGRKRKGSGLAMQQFFSVSAMINLIEA
jgi:hypothetical protein